MTRTLTKASLRVPFEVSSSRPFTLSVAYMLALPLCLSEYSCESKSEATVFSQFQKYIRNPSGASQTWSCNEKNMGTTPKPSGSDPK